MAEKVETNLVWVDVIADRLASSPLQKMEREEFFAENTLDWMQEPPGPQSTFPANLPAMGASDLRLARSGRIKASPAMESPQTECSFWDRSTDFVSVTTVFVLPPVRWTSFFCL